MKRMDKNAVKINKMLAGSFIVFETSLLKNRRISTSARICSHFPNFLAITIRFFKSQRVEGTSSVLSKPKQKKCIMIHVVNINGSCLYKLSQWCFSFENLESCIKKVSYFFFSFFQLSLKEVVSSVPQPEAKRKRAVNSQTFSHQPPNPCQRQTGICYRQSLKIEHRLDLPEVSLSYMTPSKEINESRTIQFFL